MCAVVTHADPMTALPDPDVVATLRAAGCVFAEDEAAILTSAATSPHHLATLVARRSGGEPLEQVVGWAEFCGMKVVVDPGVFVPRRRTEHLAHEAVALTAPGDVVVDLCCGTGALGAVVAEAVTGIELHAADVDAAAARCARRNLAPWGGQVHEGDLYDALPITLRGRVNVLVANTPYVPTEEVALLPTEARLHEPSVALDGGRDGLDVQRRVAGDANRWLTPGGHLLVETSDRQAPAAVAMFADAGLVARISASEQLNATVIIGTRPLRAPT
jgi:release factor glutamine methyltransferase